MTVSIRQEKSQPSHSKIKVRFADGSVAWFHGDSGLDFVVAPEFMKFFTISVLIFAILQSREDSAQLVGWQIPALWMAIAVTTAFWYTIAIVILRKLSDFIDVLYLYTPFLSLPCMLLTEAGTFYLLEIVMGLKGATFEQQIGHTIQAALAILLFDVLYGNFIALQHPMLHKTQYLEAVPQTADVAVSQPVRSMPRSRVQETPKSLPVVQDVGSLTISLSNETIEVNTLVSIQVEDHYLRVETFDRTMLIRNKLSAAVELIDPELGLQINRSTWVARSSIKSVIRAKGSSAEVLQINGNRYEVSRSRLSALLEACRRWNIVIDAAK